MKKVVIGISIILIAAGLYLGRDQIRGALYASQQPTLPPAVERGDLPATTTPPVAPAPTSTPPVETPTPAPTPRPTTFNLKVPFTTQAPHSNWDQPYQDACEEASVIGVHYFWSDQTFTPDKADSEIVKFVAFENKELGSPTGYLDTDAATTARLVEKYWPQYRTRVIYDWTIAQVEAEIAAGRPVVGFFAGKQLNNPNFKNGGPLYHALVIKGYTADNFITNDVGTRRGADYVYTKAKLLSASHDWNDGDVKNGRSAILILEKR